MQQLQQHMTPQMKKMLFIFGIVAGVILSLFILKKLFFWFAPYIFEAPPVTISATTAEAKTWHPILTSVGTLTAVNGVDITTESPGIVKEIHFDSGQSVNKGDLLIRLDTAVEEAELKSNLAQLELKQMNYSRNLTLQKKNVVSQSALDTSYAELREAEAAVEATKAHIQQKTISAPFSGKLGIRLVDLGEYVSAGKAMVTLQSLDPLFVKFNLPEQNLPKLYIQQPVEFQINLAGIKTVKGTITAINSKVDQTTRNILVQATVSNKDMQLYPGMFALVNVVLKQQDNVITLPQTSISYSLHGDSVYILKSRKKDRHGNPILHAYRQYVIVGDRRGNEVAITKGVNAGDQIVTSGQLKLQNGTHVVVDNSVEL